MCKHVETTIVRDTLDDGTPVAIHQCDFCGDTCPSMDVAAEIAADVWSLPEIDKAAQSKALQRLIVKAFQDENQTMASVVVFAKNTKLPGGTYDRQ